MAENYECQLCGVEVESITLLKDHVDNCDDFIHGDYTGFEYEVEYIPDEELTA